LGICITRDMDQEKSQMERLSDSGLLDDICRRQSENFATMDRCTAKPGTQLVDWSRIVDHNGWIYSIQSAISYSYIYPKLSNKALEIPTTGEGGIVPYILRHHKPT
jgi:hypothetical protein